MERPLLFILDEKKHSAVIDVDGISSKCYRFVWNKDLGYYTYEPKSQNEIDDIMQSAQFHQLFFFSIIVPGLFDEVSAEKKATKPKAPEPPKEPAPTPPKAPEPGTEPEPAKEPESEVKDSEFEDKDSPEYDQAYFEPIDENELGNELAKIEDKDTLIFIIEVHGGKAPAKQSGLEKFRAVAEEAIIVSREKSEETPDI